MLKLCRTIHVFLAVLVLASISPVTQAASYTFSQGGFPNGGFVTGFFTGEDTVGAVFGVNLPGIPPDGSLLACTGRQCPYPDLNEITDFSISISGNAFFESLGGVGNPSIIFFNFKLGTPDFEIAYGACSSCGPYWTYVGGRGLSPGTQGFVWGPGPGGEEIIMQTLEPIIVSEVQAVPLPGALGLLAPCLVWLGIFRSNTKAKQ